MSHYYIGIGSIAAIVWVVIHYFILEPSGLYAKHEFVSAAMYFLAASVVTPWTMVVVSKFINVRAIPKIQNYTLQIIIGFTAGLLWFFVIHSSEYEIWQILLNLMFMMLASAITTQGAIEWETHILKVEEGSQDSEKETTTQNEEHSD